MDLEKLKVWKKSLSLSVEVYKELSKLRDLGFKDQITCSSLSIPSNISEGVSRNSIKEKAHFLSIARGSCAELKTQIMIGIEIQYIDKTIGTEWLQEATEVHKMLNGLQKYIKTDH